MGPPINMVPVQGFFKFTLELLIHKWCVGTVDHIRNTEEKQDCVYHCGKVSIASCKALEILVKPRTAADHGNDHQDQSGFQCIQGGTVCEAGSSQSKHGSQHFSYGCRCGLAEKYPADDHGKHGI